MMVMVLTKKKTELLGRDEDGLISFISLVIDPLSQPPG
jgi:hypothetical protein